MSLCINPKCQNPDNPDNLLYCQSCQSELLLEGRYRVISLLGEGGFAKTYEVSDRTNIPKVIKVLSKNEPKPVEQFQREAQVLTRLHHPGVPQAEEFFTFYPKNSQEPVYCLVMEKIEGENLEKWLENRDNCPINEKLAADWLTQLANTLHEVHQQQLFHRDIKPSNIMIKPDGGLVLIDFGIAREITGTYEQKQAAGQVTKVVSDGYSPLEQVIGSAAPQSDFFALGRTFVHLLTGEHPLNLGDPYRHDIYTDELEDWRDKAPQISSILGDFIDQLMARPIQKRPANTQSILEQLAEIQQILYPNTQQLQQIQSPTATNWSNDIADYVLCDLSSCHSASVNSLAISADGQTLVSGSADQRLKVWNLANEEETHSFNHADGVLSVAISSDGKIIASGSVNKTIKVWNLETQKSTQVLTGHSGQVMSLAFHPKNNNIIFSGSGDKTIKIWDINNQKCTHTHTKHSSGITSIAVSPDGKTLVSGSYDKTIIVLPDQILESHSDVVLSVAISPDGQTVISGSRDKEIKVWNLRSGELLYTLTGHKGSVLSITISSDGKTLFSGSEDKTVKVWDLTTQQEINTITKYLDAVTSLEISPDGKTLISGSHDGTIKIWSVQ
jgi:WD40 repeat protein/predicted Ser/Thr protein kinase